MSRALSSNAVASLNALNTENAFWFLVQFRSELPEIFRYVNNTENVVAQGQTFIGYPMDITLAIDDGQTSPSVAITFDNVDRDLIAVIRGLARAPRIDIYLVLSNAPDIIEMSLEDMELVDIEFQTTSISGRLINGDLLNAAYPSDAYEASQFPTLFY